jgi:lipoate-protein ligase A
MGEDMTSNSEVHCEEWIQMRYIDLGYISLPELHAVEEAVAKSGTPTLMLWIARPATVNVGYFQSVEEEVDVEEAKKLGLAITRRPSGGGAVLFDEKELYYSIVARWSSGILPKAPRPCFKKAAEGIIFALNSFGIDAKFAGKNDVHVNGRKISGNAQTNKWQAKIQHGTFLVDFDIATAAKVLKIPVEKVADKGIGAKTMPEMVKERMTTLNRELGREVAMEEAKEALKKGFEKALGVRLVEGKLTDEEKEMAKKFVVKYEDPEWIYKR